MATYAAVVQILRPLITQPPSDGVALARTEARSEPASGSLMPIAKHSSPRAMRGRKYRFCSAVPLAAMFGPDCRSATQW